MSLSNSGQHHSRVPRTCPSCGNQTPDDAVFCSYCGKKVEVGELGIGEIAVIQEDLKNYRHYAILFLVLFVLSAAVGAVSAAWGDILSALVCFVATAICFAILIYASFEISKLRVYEKELRKPK